jgi:hypothetical protein
VKHPAVTARGQVVAGAGELPVCRGWVPARPARPLNLTRVMNIVGTKPLMAAIVA